MIRAVAIQIAKSWLYKGFLIGALRLCYRKPRLIGTCRVWGPIHFVSMMETAIEKLRVLDVRLHRRLTTERKYHFWYHHQASTKPNRAGRFNRIYTVPESFLKWGEDGVITMLVFCLFVTEILDNRFFSPIETQSRYRKVYSKTLAWLVDHQFPPELAEPYEQADMDISRFLQ